MVKPEKIESGENPITREAFKVMDQIFTNSEPSIPEMRGTQHIRRLNDGTEVLMNRYFQKGIESTGENDTIDVTISNPHENFGVSFVITENGLVNMSIERNTVSLRSHLYPRPNENLQVTYKRSESEKPLAAFKNASIVLVGWVKKTVDKDRLLPCPVTITEKTNKPNFQS